MLLFFSINSRVQHFFSTIRVWVIWILYDRKRLLFRFWFSLNLFHFHNSVFSVKSRLLISCFISTAHRNVIVESSGYQKSKLKPSQKRVRAEQKGGLSQSISFYAAWNKLCALPYAHIFAYAKKKDDAEWMKESIRWEERDKYIMNIIYHIVHKYLTTQLVAVQFLPFQCMKDRFCALPCSDFTISLSLTRHRLHPFIETGDCALDSWMAIWLYALYVCMLLGHSTYSFCLSAHTYCRLAGRQTVLCNTCSVCIISGNVCVCVTVCKYIEIKSDFLARNHIEEGAESICCCCTQFTIFMRSRQTTSRNILFRNCEIHWSRALQNLADSF